MKRGRPVHALGGTPRKDHLFVDKESLCGKWMYGGGREIEPGEAISEDALRDDDLCRACLRKAAGLEVDADG